MKRRQLTIGFDPDELWANWQWKMPLVSCLAINRKDIPTAPTDVYDESRTKLRECSDAVDCNSRTNLVALRPSRVLGVFHVRVRLLKTLKAIRKNIVEERIEYPINVRRNRVECTASGEEATGLDSTNRKVRRTKLDSDPVEEIIRKRTLRFRSN